METAVRLFAHLACRPELEIDLLRTALLIAEIEHGEIDVDHWVDEVEQLSQSADAFLRHRNAKSDSERVTTLLYYMHTVENFRGNPDDYYDPRNSFLNDVLTRRQGIPITLSLIWMEVGQRLGLNAQGIAFPGHFLLQVRSRMGRIIVDAYNGHLVAEADLRDLYRIATGRDVHPPAEVLRPAKKSEILIRMLANLRAIYTSRGDTLRLHSVLERLRALSPSIDIEDELGQAPSERSRLLN